jgi:undecaprenyl-diphosphatase
MATDTLGEPTPKTPTEAAQQLPEIRKETQTHQRGMARGYGLLSASLGAFLVFGVIAFVVRGLAPLSTDIWITQVVQNASFSPQAIGQHIPIYDELMELISVPGFWPANLIAIGAALALLLLIKRGAEAICLLAIFAGVHTSVEGVKAVLARPRPTADLARIEAVISGYSFPSGHVAGYVVLYGFLFYLAWSLMKRGWVRTLILLGSGAMVALVGVSRIYLGQHWASDVLGGYGLGFGWLGLGIWAYRRWEVWHLARLEEKKQQSQAVLQGQDAPGAGATPAGPR